jgi:hypothetical protein
VIDRATGALHLDSGTTITAALTRSAFLQTTFGATRELGIKNEPWCSWRVRRVQAGGRTFMFVLYFNAERLHSLELVENDELGLTDWKDWSEAEELRKKRSYEKLLSHEVGYRRSLTWGSVRAFYDPRRGNSFIRITYGPKPARRDVAVICSQPRCRCPHPSGSRHGDHVWSERRCWHPRCTTRSAACCYLPAAVAIAAQQAVEALVARSTTKRSE